MDQLLKLLVIFIKILNLPLNKGTGMKSINILGIEHTIEKINPSNFGLSDSIMGRWIEAESKILVNGKLSESQMNATIWHEVTHAVLMACGESELNANEDFVEKLSRAFMQIADLKIQEVK